MTLKTYFHQQNGQISDKRAEDFVTSGSPTLVIAVGVWCFTNSPFPMNLLV